MKPSLRIVKGRTEKQREAAHYYLGRGRRSRVIALTTPGTSALMPTCSWWLGLSRQQLHDRIEGERTRMQFSRFGRVDTTVKE